MALSTGTNRFPRCITLAVRALCAWPNAFSYNGSQNSLSWSSRICRMRKARFQLGGNFGVSALRVACADDGALELLPAGPEPGITVQGLAACTDAWSGGGRAFEPSTSDQRNQACAFAFSSSASGGFIGVILTERLLNEENYGSTVWCRRQRH